MIEEGERLPEFKVENQEGEEVRSSDIEDAVIYFYPKADTPGCTKEACSFRDSIQQLEDAGVTVYGISVDTVEDQKAFHEKYGLGFDLLADRDGSVAEKFGVLDGKYADRTTFVVKDGRVEKVFGDVDPEEHVSRVIDFLS